MTKKGINIIVIVLTVIAIVLLMFVLLAPNLILDGKATAPPSQTLPEQSDDECGDGDCSGSEDYYDCPEDCCGEEGYQVRTSHSCCEGLTAVQDICEFEWPEEGEETIPVLPPAPPPSTDAIKEFFTGTGEAVAPPTTPPVEPPSMCWFCVNCGDGICSTHETTENCGIDCAVCGNGICEPPNETYDTCPQDCCAEAGYRGVAPVTCCEGLTKVDPCDVEPQPDYCMITVMQEACINCGDGKCDLYENVKNCPQDCVGNVTSCDELPELDIDVLDRDNMIKFTWKPETIIPNSNIYLQESNKCVGQICDFGPEFLIYAAYQPNSPGEYSIDMPPDKLKFYQLKTKVRVGPKGANCEPQCLFKGTRSEGWYDPCTEPEPKLLKYDGCSEKKVNCCFTGTRSEGWYDNDCEKVTEENLISYDITCHLGAKLCEQHSNLMVKYDQIFERPTSYVRAAKTGINWMLYLNIHGVYDTGDLLNMGGGVFDYVAYWDAEKQQQVGSAKGDKELICEMPAEGKPPQCHERYVITGKFNLKKGYPYFVSLGEGVHSWTNRFVGKIPEHVTFEFKYGPENSEHENYIVLPLDTNITTAKDLCEAKADDGQDLMSDEDNIGFWDVANQNIIRPAPDCSFIKNYPEYNFPLEAGKIYLITVPGDRIWTQK